MQTQTFLLPAYMAQIKTFFRIAQRVDFMPQSILDAQATHLYLKQILAHAEEALTSEEHQRLCKHTDKLCGPLLMSQDPFQVELATLYFAQSTPCSN